MVQAAASRSPAVAVKHDENVIINRINGLVVQMRISLHY